jgi:hypothetical protein
MTPIATVDDALDATLAALNLSRPHSPQVRLKLVRADRETPGQLHPIEEAGFTDRAEPPADRAATEPHVTSDPALSHAGEAGVASMGQQRFHRRELLLQRERNLALRAATLRAALDWSLELHAATLDNPGGEL